MRRISFFVLFCLSSVLASSQEQFILRGKVIALPSREPLVNSNIYVEELSKGTITDSTGQFKISLPEGTYHLRVSFVGYRSERIEIRTGPEISNNFIEVGLVQGDYEEKEVIVTGSKDLSSVKTQELQNSIIKKIPTLYSDVLRTVQIMPGVSSNNEFTSSYNVRGGNFDENLIYLNGYEIYRPFLLKVGMEENHSLINPDMVEDLKFFNGSFPVVYGDKMSSALEVNYRKLFSDTMNVILKSNLLNSAVTFNKSYGKLNWSAGIRYAYPGFFLQKLQTEGLYSPTFADGQLLMNYNISEKSSAELFVIHAFNEFEYKPDTWLGHFQTELNKVSEVFLDYRGKSTYSFNTTLLGFRYSTMPGTESMISFSALYYKTREKENTGIAGDYYYSPDANMPSIEREYLKSRYQSAHNDMSLRTLEFKADYQIRFSIHELSTGAGIRTANMENYIDENQYETGSETLIEAPLILRNEMQKDFNSVYGYLQDNITIGRFQAILGLRMLYYNYSEEFLVSPRTSIFFRAGRRVILTAGFGYYYQPPFFYELRNQVDNKILKSQKAVHYSLAVEFGFKEDHSIILETFYKDLDNIIPYYIEQLKLQYFNNNDLEAYALGCDIMFKGKLREGGLDNWFTYSFMNSKEKNKYNGEGYSRRLLDQRHTIQIFLQDRIPQWKNWQSHLRLTFGSGYLFHYRKLVMNESTGKYEIFPTYEDKIVLPFYSRADMGLSTTFQFKSKRQLVLTIEVQNVFNKYNVAGYNFIQVFKDVKWPITIPQLFSRRFFNVGVEYSF